MANKHHPLTPAVAAAIAARRPEEALRIIQHEMFFMLNKHQPVGSRVHAYLEKHNVYPYNRVETTNTTTSVNCIAQNLGFGYFLDTGVESTKLHKDLVFFDLKTPELTAPLCVVYKKNASFSLAAREFIDFVKEYYTSL